MLPLPTSLLLPPKTPQRKLTRSLTKNKQQKHHQKSQKLQSKRKRMATTLRRLPSNLLQLRMATQRLHKSQSQRQSRERRKDLRLLPNHKPSRTTRQKPPRRFINTTLSVSMLSWVRSLPLLFPTCCISSDCWEHTAKEPETVAPEHEKESAEPPKSPRESDAIDEAEERKRKRHDPAEGVCASLSALCNGETDIVIRVYGAYDYRACRPSQASLCSSRRGEERAREQEETRFSRR